MYRSNVLPANIQNDIIRNAVIGDRTSKDQLVKRYSGLIYSIAYKSNIKCPPHISVEDIYHDGIVELLTSLKKYNPNSGAFAPWIYRRVKFSIDECLRKSCAINISRQIWRNYKKSVAMGIEDTKIPYGHILKPESIYSPIKDHPSLEKHELLIGDMSPEEEVIHKETCLEIYKAIMTLSEVERNVTVLAFGLYGYPILHNAQIGQIVHRTTASTSQIKTRALKKLAHRIPQNIMWRYW